MIIRFVQTLLVFVVSLIIANQAYAQTITVEEFKKILTEQAGFGPADFENVDKGKAVSRRLKSQLDHEIAIVGVIKLRAPNDLVLKAFHRVIEIQEKKTSEEYGEFSKTPVMADFKGLTIPDGELLDLKGCKVGSCKWNLPAALIKRVSTDFDWEAEGKTKRADKMMREILLNLVINYSKEGDSALFEYNDKPDPVILRSEYESIQKELFFVDQLAPGFAKYLESFPEGEPMGIMKTQNWSKIKIALKPVIILTQNITLQASESEQPATFIISKQIYANHYFDSTLAQTSVITFKTGDGKEESYLMFMNRSRAGAFRGTLGKLARGIVESQAYSRLEAVLMDTKKRVSFAVANRNADLEMEEELDEGFNYYSWMIWGLVLIVGGALVYWVFMMARKKGL